MIPHCVCSGALAKGGFRGVFSSASAITGSIDRTLAHASFDKQTVAEQSRVARDKPKHVGEGLLMGAAEVMKGFGLGAMNLFAKPIDGAITDGAKGFFTGVGKGLLGKSICSTRQAAFTVLLFAYL